MNNLKLSRLSKLDVKWVSELVGNEHLRISKANPFHELIMVTEGPVYLQIGEEKITLASGECFLLMPWEQHSGWRQIGEASGFYWVQFAVEPAISPIAEYLSLSNAESAASVQDLRVSGHADSDYLVLPRRIKPANRYEWLGMFEQLRSCFNRPKGYYRYHCSLLLAQILGLIADQLLEQLPRNKETSKETSTTYLLYRKLVNVLDEEYATELSSHALERRMQHAYPYLCQLFKKHAGMSMGTYIQQLRIQRAKHLLRNTSLNVRDIAAQCGFKDAYYFSRLFKKHEKRSPQQFRIGVQDPGDDQ